LVKIIGRDWLSGDSTLVLKLKFKKLFSAKKKSQQQQQQQQQRKKRDIPPGLFIKIFSFSWF